MFKLEKGNKDFEIVITEIIPLKGAAATLTFLAVRK